MPEGRTVIKRVENCVLYSDETILVQNVRLSYPHLTKPYKAGGKHSAVGLAPKSTHSAMKDLLKDEITRLVRDNLANKKNPNPAIPAANWFLRDGNLSTDKPEYKGNWTINASETEPPMLRGKERDPKTGKARIIAETEASRVFYAGCRVNMLIKPWWQDSEEWGKKVNANLIAVQFVADDEPFGTGRVGEDVVDDTFEPIGDDEDGYDDSDDEL